MKNLGRLVLAVALLPLFIMGCAKEQENFLKEAGTLYKEKDYSGAIAKYEEALDRSTDASVKEKAWYDIGQIHRELENYEQAIRAFQRLIENFPDSSFLEEAMFHIAYYLGELGRNGESIEWYEKLVKKFPESQTQYLTLAYFNQGATYYKEKDYDKARENYEKSSQSTTDRNMRAKIQLRIGRTYNAQDKHEQAIESYKSLLEEYPDSEFIAQGKRGIANSYFQVEKWNEAITWYWRGTDVPDSTDFEGVLDWYQKTIDASDSTFSGQDIERDLYQIWKASYEQQKYKYAWLAFQKLFGNFPKTSYRNLLNNGRDLINRGDSLRTEGSYEDALQAYEDAWEIFKSVDKKISGVTENKIISAIISAEISTGTKWAMFGIGVAKYHLKNYETAREKLEEILKDREAFDFHKDRALLHERSLFCVCLG